MPRQRKDGKRRRRVLHLLVAAAALANGGCLLAAAGAAAGGATAYYYFKGKVCQEFPSTFHDTWLAAQTALQNLQLPLVANENNGSAGKLTSRTADGTAVTIDLEVIPSRIPAEGSVTRACVRVGTFGDEAVSRRILDQVGAHLTRPTWPPSPPRRPAPPRPPGRLPRAPRPARPPPPRRRRRPSCRSSRSRSGRRSCSRLAGPRRRPDNTADDIRAGRAMMRSVIGLDIGGANLKAAHSSGACRTRPFPLWRDPASLPCALGELLSSLPPGDELAVTMTGELCDCFASKHEGVHHILDAIAVVAGPRPVLVWRTDGRLVDLATARSGRALLVAAANWLALATWAGRLVPSGPALLLDVGSTTTDIIPLSDGRPVAAGRTDPERLRLGELVYTGARRTPVCAVLGSEGLAAEWFATVYDVYLVLGLVADDPSNSDTADRRPATTEFAHARLARMFCGDLETSSAAERLDLARRAHRCQVEQLRHAATRAAARLSDPQAVVLAGSGEFLARRVVAATPFLSSCRVVSLREEMGAAISEAACAYAVAVLATEARA